MERLHAEASVYDILPQHWQQEPQDKVYTADLNGFDFGGVSPDELPDVLEVLRKVHKIGGKQAQEATLVALHGLSRQAILLGIYDRLSKGHKTAHGTGPKSKHRNAALDCKESLPSDVSDLLPVINAPWESEKKNDKRLQYYTAIMVCLPTSLWNVDSQLKSNATTAAKAATKHWYESLRRVTAFAFHAAAVDPQNGGQLLHHWQLQHIGCLSTKAILRISCPSFSKGCVM